MSPNRAAVDEAEIRRIADELFITTDLKNWTAARALFAEGPIEVDMSSLVGGGPVQLTADQLIEGRVLALPAGTDLWETWGNYRLSYRRVAGEWRLDGFRYYSKMTRGNDAVRTHTQ